MVPSKPCVFQWAKTPGNSNTQTFASVNSNLLRFDNALCSAPKHAAAPPTSIALTPPWRKSLGETCQRRARRKKKKAVAEICAQARITDDFCSWRVSDVCYVPAPPCTPSRTSQISDLTNRHPTFRTFLPWPQAGNGINRSHHHRQFECRAASSRHSRT